MSYDLQIEGDTVDTATCKRMGLIVQFTAKDIELAISNQTKVMEQTSAQIAVHAAECEALEAMDEKVKEIVLSLSEAQKNMVLSWGSCAAKKYEETQKYAVMQDNLKALETDRDAIYAKFQPATEASAPVEVVENVVVAETVDVTA
jgi:hypothetical protein